MTAARSYKQRDLKLLWGLSGHLCAYPECRQSFSPDRSDSLVGEIAHIVAVSSDGPRGDPSYPQDRLDDYDNLVLLCPTHHTLVDDKNSQYSVSDLRMWKEAHEDWVAQKLSEGELWDSSISQPYYYNIPRLGILAAGYGFQIDDSILDPDRVLLDYGLELNSLLLGLERLLSEIEPKAIPLNRVTEFSDALVGTVLSFEGGFRTKGVPYGDKLRTFQMQGNPAKDPHIYKKLKDTRLVMTINPKWIATSTALCELTSGNFTCAGLGLVKRWEPKSRDLFASPLIIGFPKSPFDSVFSFLG